MQNSFYNADELLTLGFKSIGQNVLISRNANFYGINNIEIGHHVRIDDFCILSGEIKLGNYIHVSAFSALYGKYGIEMQDFSGLSPRCTIFSATDDFSGDYLIGPMLDSKLTNVKGERVLIEKYCHLGCNCVALPGVKIREGSVAGAMSLITHDMEPWKIYKGIPAQILKSRKKGLLDYINQVL
jgi:acetyltransferase-like isoleucine patch superfamily enzyme